MECLDFVPFCFFCFSREKGPDHDSYAGEAGTIVEGEGDETGERGDFFFKGKFLRRQEGGELEHMWTYWPF